jgi:hypothetical protein
MAYEILWSSDMGFFSIWHWLILLFMFVPAIVGIVVMGWQRTVIVKHEESGLLKKGYVGYSLTYLVFGWCVPIVRGEIAIGLIHFVLTVVTLGFFQYLVMPYLYNKQYMTRLLTNGWQLNGDDESNAYAKRKLSIAN